MYSVFYKKKKRYYLFCSFFWENCYQAGIKLKLLVLVSLNEPIFFGIRRNKLKNNKSTLFFKPRSHVKKLKSYTKCILLVKLCCLLFSHILEIVRK